MNTSKNSKNRILASLAIAVALSAGATLAACSSDDSSNPSPVVHDGGTTNTPDTSVTPGVDSGPSSDDAGPGVDANLPDVGACKSDASTCNSCFTPQQDPVNGCSPAAVGCIPFTKTVPQAP